MIKMFKVLLVGLVVSIVFASNLFAGMVSGYYKSNGTYVQPYYRSEPNKTVKDNYNYYGNTNPYSGKTGINYYKSSPSSDYYDSNSIFNNNNSIFKGKSIFGN